MTLETVEDDLDEMQSSAKNAPSAGSGQQSASGGIEGDLISPEISGDSPVLDSPTEGESGTVDGDENRELENPVGAESDEEFVEASDEQLAAESGQDSAVSDLQGIDGFEFAPYDTSEAAEATGHETLTEIGEVLEGDTPEDPEFGFLAGLIPTLVSSVGPPLAKAVARKLKPRTMHKIRSLAKTTLPQQRSSRRGRTLGMLSKLFESAESMPSTESGTDVDEILVDEAVTVLESIIGDDNRVRIRHTTQLPWRQVCALRIRFRNGRVYRGTGFLIGPRTVATAGHCVYLKKEGGWAESIEVIPGADGSSRPFGSATSRQFRSVAGWVNNGKPACDYGCVILPPGSFGGRNLGAFGFAALEPSELLASSAVIGGYPGDKPFAELWGMARRLRSVSANQLSYDIDTKGGQSGAPVYIRYRGQRICCGIHNYGGSTSNTATRITRPVYERLAGWRKL